MGQDSNSIPQPNMFIRAWRSLKSSQFWHYPHYLLNQTLFHGISALLKYNGYQAQPGKNPVWSIVLGDITDKAFESKDGYSEVPLYFLGLRVMSIMSVVDDKESVNNFHALEKRYAFDFVPQLGLGGMFFMSQKWNDPTTGKAKGALISSLHKNHHRLWGYGNEVFDNLLVHWAPEKCAAVNFGMLPLRILYKTIYGNAELPVRVFELTEEAEKQWQDLDHFTPGGLEAVKSEMLQISRRLEAEMKAEDESLKLAYSLKERLTDLQQKVHLPESPDAYNTLALFGITQNVSRAMIGLAKVMASHKHMSNLREERTRLLKLMELKGIDPRSEDAFNIIRHHSEVYQRYFLEIVRTQHNAPVEYRVNLNLTDWFEGEYIINKEKGIKLPPRTIAVYPQGRIARHERDWSNPDKFDPFRKEYTFEFSEEDPTKISRMPKNQPKVFGGGKRVCAGRAAAKDIILMALWRLPEYEFKVTAAEKATLKTLPDKNSHHSHMLTESAKQVKGVLTKFAGVQLSAKPFDDASNDGVNDIGKTQLPTGKARVGLN